MANPLRVVVFEDDFLLAEALADALTRLGCDLIHCCGSFREAMRVIDKADFDLAIVDLDLQGFDASPILDRLADCNISVLLATASNEEFVPERFAQTPRLTKPYDHQQLKKAIEQLQMSGSFRTA